MGINCETVLTSSASGLRRYQGCSGAVGLGGVLGPRPINHVGECEDPESCMTLEKQFQESRVDQGGGAEGNSRAGSSHSSISSSWSWQSVSSSTEGVDDSQDLSRPTSGSASSGLQNQLEDTRWLELLHSDDLSLELATEPAASSSAALAVGSSLASGFCSDQSKGVSPLSFGSGPSGAPLWEHSTRLHKVLAPQTAPAAGGTHGCFMHGSEQAAAALGNAQLRGTGQLDEFFLRQESLNRQALLFNNNWHHQYSDQGHGIHPPFGITGSANAAVNQARGSLELLLQVGAGSSSSFDTIHRQKRVPISSWPGMDHHHSANAKPAGPELMQHGPQGNNSSWPSQSAKKGGKKTSDSASNKDGKRVKGSGHRTKRNSQKKEPALNTNLKPRAKQGCANDPQSIAARQRRERISDRLKILQELIPNGSKVDLVTMLEKAINYVKFLQLQVKVLMNDDYWPKREQGDDEAQVEAMVIS